MHSGVLCEAVPMKYAFIRDHAEQYPVRRLCSVLKVHPSGYYAWRRNPKSRRAREDGRLLRLIRQSWEDSGRIYGYRKVTHDLRDIGEHCGRHRVARLMRQKENTLPNGISTPSWTQIRSAQCCSTQPLATAV